MKKIVLFLLLMANVAFSQENTATVKAGKYQMNIPEVGVNKDSLVVWNGVTKIMKILPVSQLKTITNIDYVATPTGGTIFSSTGNDAVVPLATTTNAGLQSPADKAKVNGLDAALANKVDKISGKGLSAEDYTTAEKTKLAGLSNFDPTSINNSLANKVDKISGKGLSTEDYSTAEKTKLAGVANGATANSTDAALRDRSTHTGSQTISTVIGLQAAIDAKINVSLIGVNNGITPLDPGGKVSFAYLPASLMIYKGMWNPATNTPTLADGTGVAGWVYKATVPGTVNLGSGNMSFYAGDFVIHNGTKWERSAGTDAVVSVNGQQGIVTLTTTNIAEGTNQYYTDARVSANAQVTANTAKVTNQTHTGDATGSTALTLATVNSNVGTFGNASNSTTQTVNAKGLTTSISNVPIQIAESQVTGLVADLAAKQATLVSGTNIKTVGGTTLLGSGDIPFPTAISTNLALGTTTATMQPITNSNGTGLTLPSVTTTLAGLMPSADKVKLNGIATGATANQTDAFLLARANQTGVQPISTVTGLQTELDSKLPSNTAITGGTNTKITYDSKGLVTGGASLLASDVPILNQNTTGSSSSSDKLNRINATNANTVGSSIGLHMFSNTTGSTNFPSSAGVGLELRRDLGSASAQGSFQLWSENSASGDLYLRKVIGYSGGDTWSTWQKLWNSGNFDPANYVPLNGTGATGTWGINISGSSDKWKGLQYTSSPQTAPTLFLGTVDGINYGFTNVSQMKTALGISNAITGTGTANQVSYWNGANSQTGSSSFTWDDTTKILDLGTGQSRTNRSANGTAASPVFDQLNSYGLAGSGVFTAGIYAGNSFASSNGTWLKFVVNGTAPSNPIDALVIDPSGGATFNGVMRINSLSEYLRHTALTVGQTQIQSWYNSSGVRRGYIGFGNTSVDNLTLSNDISGGTIHLNTNSGSVNTNSSLNVTGNVTASATITGKDLAITNFFSLKGVGVVPSIGGSGLEVFNPDIATTQFQTFNRSAGTYNAFLNRASKHTWSIGSVEKMILDVNGNLNVTGTIDGSNLSGTNTGDQTTITGNAGTATTLQTARTIGLSGVTATATSFNGSANITIPITAVPATLLTGTASISTTGSAATLTTARTIWGQSFNGSANVTGAMTGITNATGSGIADFARFFGNSADTAALPSFSFTGDPNTGIWNAATDAVGITAGGVNRVTVSTTALTSILPLTGTSATFSSTITASDFIKSSDIRLKDVVSRDGDVAYYTLKKGDTKRVHTGYIAQEKEVTNPSQIYKDDKGYLAVDYIEILVGKVRELEKMVEYQNKRIEQLEKKN